MKDWEQTEYTDTFKKFVDNSNTNAENSEFLDKMTGTILCNGVLFNGNETIDGEAILPLTNAKSSGVVNSDTILDNFILYFRDENKIVQLDQFPIDLLSFNDNKLHFIYIKSDYTYRISDYMFGRADEVLLGRFVITESSTWNQFYIMAQRCGTPMYDAADEFYDVEGMYVKSPENLNLSMESGKVKRSGIQFTDYNSPDIYEFFNLSSEKVPLRYINEYNEVDYTQDQTYDVISNRYMVYNMNKKLKIEAEEYINSILNLTYSIKDTASKYASELKSAIIEEETEETKQSIIDNYLLNITNIYEVVDKLYDLLGDDTLSDSVKRTSLYTNKTAINDYIDTNLKNISNITSEQVAAINTTVDYIKLIDTTVYDNPLETALDTIQDELNSIEFDVGSIQVVDEGKFTIQRILWDIYDGSLIVQYGDTVYDTYDEAVSGTELLSYPAPWGKTIYIPLAVLMIKSGITSINDDEDTLIVSRRWIEVDQEQEGFIDYVARAKAQKALDLLDGLEDRLKAYIDEIADDLKEDVQAELDKMQGIIDALKLSLETEMTELETKVDNLVPTRVSSSAFSVSRHYVQPGWMEKPNGGNTLYTSSHNAIVCCKQVTKSGYYPLAIIGAQSASNEISKNYLPCDIYSPANGSCYPRVIFRNEQNGSWDVQTNLPYVTVTIIWLKL